MNRPEVLDCTLRDGGYYTDWDYADETVRRYVSTITGAGVHIVEIGFRSNSTVGFAGKFLFSRDRLLARLFEGHDVRVAVMIDGSDFIDAAGRPDLDAVAASFAPSHGSRVDLVRITCTPATLEPVLELATAIKESGYETSLNIMRASLMSTQEMAGTASRVSNSAADILYIADSFGGLSPSRTSELVLAAREHFGGRIGFHAHDNMGLAMANSLSAIDAGASIVDGSLLGMGRGAGNLRTEQLLLHLNLHAGDERFRPSELFDVVENDFRRLQERHGWGANLAYMLSGGYDVHPTYAQRLLAVSVRYAPMEVLDMLESLHATGKATSFSTELLSSAIEGRSMAEELTPIEELRGTRPGLPDISGRDEFIVLASGPSVAERAADINDFIADRDPVVIECNFQERISSAPCHFSVFVNHERMRKFAASVRAERTQLIVGMGAMEPSLAGSFGEFPTWHYGYHVAESAFAVGETECAIPFDAVGMYAIALSLRMGARTIYLCGFDGYVGHEAGGRPVPRDHIAAHQEMDVFSRLLCASADIAEGRIKIASLTPTVYELPQDSIYRYL